MKQTARWMKVIFMTVLAVAVTGFAAQARDAEFKLADFSPLTGVAFDDRPLQLPVQRNFQMAMLTASSELGRSCGKIEAYGWRMSQTEQGRVNQIYNNTVDRLRLMGYSIAPQALASVSRDITLFTADRSDKHFIFLWSAGELGLALNLCATSAPQALSYRSASNSPSVQVFQMPMDDLALPARRAGGKKGGKAALGGFSPVGEWVGSYTCTQGYTGGTLEIYSMRGENFEGVFKFYPTEKNALVPEGSYTVYGQYDKESKNILVNPGKWIRRPHSYYNTVIVGSFDPVRDSFSAYFQGISGCTSFEAHRFGAQGVSHALMKFTPAAAKHAVAKHAVKKKKCAPKPEPLATIDTLPVPAAPAAAPPAPDLTAPADDKKNTTGGIVLSPPPVAAPATTAPAPTAPASIPPAPSEATPFPTIAPAVK